MKQRKSVHILLATLLCFAQLVASAHVVGHFQLHNSPSHSVVAAGHTHVHAAKSDHHHDDSPIRSFIFTGNVTGKDALPKDALVRVDHSPDAAENDCAIYHVFLSLGGVLSNSMGDRTTTVICEGVASFDNTYRPHFLLSHTRIRAPPTIS